MSWNDEMIGVDDEGLFAYGHQSETQTIKRKKYGGYCNSHSCVDPVQATRTTNPNYKYMVYNDIRLLKTTDKAVKSCPDCGHALFWDEISEDNEPLKPAMRSKKR